MTEEQIALARRAVACRGWRWMPGMLTLDDERMSDEGWPTYDVLEYGASGVAERVEWDNNPKKGAIPDLQDPATLGCLLALVREAWGDPTICVVLDTSDGYWHVGRWEDDGIALRGRWGTSEAHALVLSLEGAMSAAKVALEAAP